MSFVHQIMLYFCTAVCALYLISGGYSVIKNYFQRKIDERAAEKNQSEVCTTEQPEHAITHRRGHAEN
ncbi:TPA: DUF1378 family protein [Escherichia coli]